MNSTVNRQQLARDQLVEGLKHLEAGAPGLAQPVLEAAVSLAPEWADTHYNLGVALVRQGDWPAAERACRAALDIDPNLPHAMHMLGAILCQDHRLDEALVLLAKSVQLKPDEAAARRDLGVVHLFLGNIDAARENLLICLEQDPTLRQALPTLIELTPVDEHPAQAARVRDIMRRMTKVADRLSAPQQIDLHYAIGNSHDQRGETDAAFAALSQANRLKRVQVEFNSDDSDARLAGIQAAFTPQLFDRLRGQGLPSEQPICIFGMPRSGTTLVEQIISAHPQVQAAGESMALLNIIAHSRGPGGEIYPDWCQQMQPGDCQSVGEAYLGSLPALEAGQTRTTDKRLENVEHLGLLHLALPNAALIHCQRDRLDNAFSCFATQFLGGQPWSNDLEEIGRYWRAQDQLMAYWRTQIAPERLLTVSYEGLVGDLEGWARRIVAHCGLPWDAACLRFHQSRRAVRSASAAQVRRPIYTKSIGRWKPYEAHLGPLLKGMDGRDKSGQDERRD